MKRLTISTLLVFLCLFPFAALSNTFSIWTDESMTNCHVYTNPDTMPFYSFYIFLEPGPDGAFAAEYKVPVFENHYMQSIDINPVVSGAPVGVWYGSPGIGAPFTSCQTDLFWICKMNMFELVPRSRGYILLEENDDTSFLGVAICPAPRPLADGWVYNGLAINRSCATPWMDPPWLEGAEAILPNKVLADFDLGVTLCSDDSFEFRNHFFVYNMDEPYDTISVIGGEWLDRQWIDNIGVYPASPDSCLLTLENGMFGGNNYILQAYSIGRGWCFGPIGYATTESDFTCPVVATQLQQFSASLSASRIMLEWSLSSIDPGTVFHISRRELDEPFNTIGEIAGTEHRLSYMFEDRSVSGGKTYIYRVEYISDTDSGILFETDAVETAPIPVTLAQNHPNPFNPSTTIEFYIPEAGQVSLRVFDVSGRLVRTLVDNTMEPGTHSVTWNGLDENGASVPSGVYFSRFRTGKTTLSKKMILLR